MSGADVRCGRGQRHGNRCAAAPERQGIESSRRRRRVAVVERPGKGAPTRWASEPTDTARPPSSRKRATMAGPRGTVSPAAGAVHSCSLRGSCPTRRGPRGWLVQLRGRGEVGGRDVGCEIALDEVDVAHRIEQPGASARRDLREVRGPRSRRGLRPSTKAATRRRRRASPGRRGRADDEVVVVRAATRRCGRPAPVPGDLDPEPDGDAAVGPAGGGVANDLFALGERRVRERRAPWGRSRRGR